VPDVRDVHTYPHSYTIFHSNASGPKGPRPRLRRGATAVRPCMGVWGAKRGRKAERLGAIPPWGGRRPTPKTPKKWGRKFSEFTKTLTCGKCGTPPTPLYKILLERRKQRKMDLAIFQDDPLGLLENSQVAPPTRYRANRKKFFLTYSRCDKTPEEIYSHLSSIATIISI